MRNPPPDRDPQAAAPDDAAHIAQLKQSRRWRDAEDVAERWRARADAQDDVRGLALACAELVGLRAGRRDHAGAEQAFTDAAAAADRLGDVALRFAALAAGGEHAFQRRHLRQARERWTLALQAARSAGDLTAEARALTALAEVHQARRASAEARRHLEEALDLARRAADPARETAVCLALAESSSADPVAMASWLRTAAAVARPVGDLEPLLRHGRHLLRQRQLDEAQALAAEAVAVARQGGEGVALSRALLLAMEVHEAAARVPEALAVARERVELLRRLDDAHGGALALADQGRLESLLGRARDAARSFDAGLRAARVARKKALDVRLLKELAEARVRDADVGGAINALLEAARMALSLGRSLDAIEVLERMGGLGEFDGRPDHYARRVEELATDCAPDADARDQLARARVLVHFGLHETAVRQLAQARGGDPDTDAQLLMVLGQSHRLAGRIGRAVTAFERRVAHERTRGEPRDLAFGLNSLGAALVDQGSTPAALAAFAEGLALLRDLEDVAGEGILLNGLALAHHAAGDAAQALALLDRSLGLQAEHPDQGDLAVTLNIRGEVLCTLGRGPEALADLERSKGLLAAAGDPRGLSFALPRLGRARLLCGDRDGALRDLREAVALTQRGADRRQAVRVLLLLGEVLRQGGQLDEARRLVQAARDRVERMEDPLLRQQVERAPA